MSVRKDTILFSPKVILLFLCNLIYSSFSPSFGQEKLNLDFEIQNDEKSAFPFWSFPRSISFQYDTIVKYTGHSSLRLDLTGNSVFHGAFYTTSVPVVDFKTKNITVSAWIKTQDFDGAIQFYATTVNHQESDRLSFVRDTSLIEEGKWNKYQVEIPVPAQTDYLAIGMFLSGQGKIWIDHWQIICEGQEYKDIPLPSTQIVTDTLLSLYEPDLSFEDTKKNTRLLKQTTLTTDSLYFKEGRQSLKLQNGIRANAPLLQVISLDTLWGKTLSVKGFIRKYSFAKSTHSVFFSFISNDKRFRNSWFIHKYLELPIQLTSLSDTSGEWMKFSVETPIPDNEYLKYASIGVVSTDASAFWLDNIKILVDGQAPPSVNAPALPTLAETTWLKKAIIPLKSTSPSDPFTDLLALNEKIGKAHMIGLGENTHGSHEIFQMKHRLIRWLVEQKGFNVIAFEADMAAAEDVNKYVLTGKGDARKVLKGLGYWTWSVEEIAELISWVRQYNVAHPKQMVQFKGFDMQYSWKALAALKEYLQPKDTLAWHSLKKRMEYVQAIRRFVPPTDTTIVSAMQALREVKNTFLIRVPVGSLSEKSLIQQHFRQIEQAIELRSVGESSRFRDACMAENLYRSFSSIPNARVVIWAHNNHVDKYDMGYWLKTELADDYQSIGFTFDQGTFRAIYKDSVQLAPAQTSVAGSYESYFKTAQTPMFYLPLQKTPLIKDTQWLHQRLLFRNIGAEAYNDDFTRRDLLKEFDALIYIQKSTPSKPLVMQNK
ncbi:erythromycin esterase family protein [Cytophagaceae bacterium DM2B3-1]|uniref:Erythromycin esterase family protein n=1 Tax=Xanthocytophaga flava TaxID=3048013 RepID=A0ABT7CK36_9BACT|nr:erythromycin esterase family protein [Xanthocytophaga flavus]MDJ1494104.1 erythromycin esterase family protein [Xanthocytophaga flavus]